MRCAYNAGVLDALNKNPAIPRFDIVIAASGSSGPAAYYVAGQIDFMEQAFGDVLATKRLINPFRLWRVMDVDYLVDNIFTNQIPLDTKAITESVQNLYIPAVHAKTGRLKYFTNRNMRCILQAIKASHAVPMMTRVPILVDGDYYHDSLTSSYPDYHILMARRLGAKKIIVIDCLSDPALPVRLEYLATRRHSLEFRGRIYKRCQKLVEEFGKKDPKYLLRIRPSEKVPCGRLDINKERLLAAVNLGRKDGAHHTITNFFV